MTHKISVQLAPSALYSYYQQLSFRNLGVRVSARQNHAIHLAACQSDYVYKQPAKKIIYLLTEQ